MIPRILDQTTPPVSPPNSAPDEPLVSLIVPCYNVADVCGRFFQSLLDQTYTHAQLIFVNDGSTDGTDDAIQAQLNPLKAKGYEIVYILQENRGLGGAVNTGLKHVKGDYICWADPDDYFEPDSFGLRVAYMKEHPECAALDCNANIRSWGSLGETLGKEAQGLRTNNNPDQFESLLRRESIFCAGCHMVATWALKAANPKMDIFECRRGQNWQLLLPVYYWYPRHFLDVPVYDYVVMPNSMSRDDTYKQSVERLDEHDEIIRETLQRIAMPAEELKYWLDYNKTLTVRLKMYAAAGEGNKRDFATRYKELAGRVALEPKDRLRWMKVMMGL